MLRSSLPLETSVSFVLCNGLSVGHSIFKVIQEKIERVTAPCEVFVCCGLLRAWLRVLRTPAAPPARSPQLPSSRACPVLSAVSSRPQRLLLLQVSLAHGCQLPGHPRAGGDMPPSCPCPSSVRCACPPRAVPGGGAGDRPHGVQPCIPTGHGSQVWGCAVSVSIAGEPDPP